MNYFLKMFRGDTLSFGVELEGLDQNLESAYFTVRKSYDDTKEPVLEKSLGDGIEMVEINQYVVRVAPEDTVDVTPGMYYYDLEVAVNGDVFTILDGVLTIEPDVTVGKRGE